MNRFYGQRSMANCNGFGRLQIENYGYEPIQGDFKVAGPDGCDFILLLDKELIVLGKGVTLAGFSGMSFAI